jgi:hypothetical protein
VERQEVLCHKWIESAKAGYEIGFERALLLFPLRAALPEIVRPPVNQAKLAVLDGERSEFARLARASP